MDTTTATARPARKVVTVSQDDYEEATENYAGFCVACGKFTNDGVEPDAHGYECDCCGARKVCGAEDALLCGYIDIA